MALGSMFGRLGSVVFSYTLGLLLDYHCNAAFVITITMFIRKFSDYKNVVFDF